MGYDNPAIVSSPTGVDPSPFPRSAGVSRFNFTYDDFNVAAEVETLRILPNKTGRQLVIKDLWVLVSVATSDNVVLDFGDENTRDGFLRNVDLSSTGVKKADSTRGAYFINGTPPVLGDGVDFGASNNAPTVTAALSGESLDLSTLTAGEWSVFVEYAWIDTADHPVNSAGSKTPVATPSRAGFTRKAKWSIKAYAHTTAEIPHNGASGEDFTLTVSEDVFLVVSSEIELITGIAKKQLTLDWYLDDGYTERHPVLKPSNFSDLSAFVIDADSEAGSAQPLMLMGVDLSSSPANGMYFRLSDANSDGGSSSYKITVYVRVLEWIEV